MFFWGSFIFVWFTFDHHPSFSSFSSNCLSIYLRRSQTKRHGHGFGYPPRHWKINERRNKVVVLGTANRGVGVLIPVLVVVLVVRLGRLQQERLHDVLAAGRLLRRATACRHLQELHQLSDVVRPDLCSRWRLLQTFVWGKMQLAFGGVNLVDVPQAKLPLHELDSALGTLELLDNGATLLLLGAERLWPSAFKEPLSFLSFVVLFRFLPTEELLQVWEVQMRSWRGWESWKSRQEWVDQSWKLLR